MSGNKDPKDTKDAAQAETAGEAAALQAQIDALSGQVAAQQEQIELLVMEIGELNNRVSLAESRAGTAAAAAPKAEPAAFDTKAYPAGLYVLAAAKMVSGVLDHPLKDVSFREGRPQEMDPAKDVWLQQQILKGYIIPFVAGRAAEAEAGQEA